MPVQVLVAQVACNCFFVLAFGRSLSAFLAAAIAALKCFWHAANGEVAWRAIAAGDVASSES